MLEPLLPSHCSSEHSCTLLFVVVCRSNSLGWVVVVGVVVVGVVVVVVVGRCVDVVG